MTTISRRDALKTLAAASFAGRVTGPGGAAEASSPQSQAPVAGEATRRRHPIGLVSRHVQWTPMEDAVAVAKEAGFDEIEWNVRTGGHIDPARVAQDLPKAVDLTKKAGLAVRMITTSIQDADSPHVRAILETASGLGVRCYRGGQYFRFDYSKGLWAQLEALKPRVAGLAALNARYGTQVAYHTHSAPGNIGGNIWDFWEVIKGLDPKHVGLNYDIGHAVARGGNGWIDGAMVTQTHIAALAIKDVLWSKGPRGWRGEFVPVGEGMIDLPRLSGVLDKAGFAGPVNIHYEHNGMLGEDLGKWALPMPRDRYLALLKADLAAVRAGLQAAPAPTRQG
jgi:sugar phosphate isomerase/epimerase